jgi:hypothetical protein
MRLLRVLFLMTVLLGLGAVAVYQYQVLPSVAKVGGVGDEIHIDDVGATLLGGHRVAGVGDGPARVGAKGMFVLVDVRIANHAKRADYQFEDEHLRLVDAAGNEYEVAAEAQKYLRSQHADGCAGALPPGGVCTTQLVFDVPASAGELQLRMKLGSGVMDMLDTVMFGKQRLKLP